MLGNFNPSTHLNEVYNIMEDYDQNFDQYAEGAIDAIVDYLENTAKVEYQYCCTSWHDDCGGVCSIAFIDENGHPQLVCFDYLRDGCYC